MVEEFDAQMRASDRHVLLLLDNCPIHPKTIPELTNTTLCFLPHGLTEYLQPLDTGIFKKLKERFKSKLRQKEGEMKSLEFLRLFDDCWSQIDEETITEAFFKSGYLPSMTDRDYFGGKDLSESEVSWDRPHNTQQSTCHKNLREREE